MLDFGAISQKQQSTEPVSEVRHIILTPSQPVFVLFLYLILPLEIKSTNINKTNNYISFQMIEKKDHNICRWKSSSWLGTGTNMYQAVYSNCCLTPSDEKEEHVSC
jgi:hypothetical protein